MKLVLLILFLFVEANAKLSTNRIFKFKLKHVPEMNETIARKYCDDNYGNLSIIEGIWQARSSSRFLIRRIPKEMTPQSKYAKYQLILVDYRGSVFDLNRSSRKPGAIWAEIDEPVLNNASMVMFVNPDSDIYDYPFRGQLRYRLYRGSTIDLYKKSDIVLTVFRQYMGGDHVDNGSGGTGTGYALNNNGYFITCHHVIDGAKTIHITGYESDYKVEYEAKVVVSDKKSDVALLKVIDKNMPQLPPVPYSIRKSEVVVGENCVSAGYPQADIMGTELKVTQGIVNAASGFGNKKDQFQFSATIFGGNSGGPIFDRDGNVIGTTTAQHPEGDAYYAVKNSFLFDLLSLFPFSLEEGNKPLAKSLTLEEMIEEYRKYIYLIKVNK